MLPAIVGGLSVTLARSFRIIDPNLKNPSSKHCSDRSKSSIPCFEIVANVVAQTWLVPAGFIALFYLPRLLHAEWNKPGSRKCFPIGVDVLGEPAVDENHTRTDHLDDTRGLLRCEAIGRVTTHARSS